MKFDTAINFLFALAAVAGASFYGYDVLSRNTQEVHADGASLAGKDGFTVVSHTDGKGGNYLVVTTYEPNPKDPTEIRRVMIVYEIKGESEGKAKLYLVGSRCIEHDGYFDLLNFDAKDGYKPDQLKHEYDIKHK